MWRIDKLRERRNPQPAPERDPIRSGGAGVALRATPTLPRSNTDRHPGRRAGVQATCVTWRRPNCVLTLLMDPGSAFGRPG